MMRSKQVSKSRDERRAGRREARGVEHGIFFYAGVVLAGVLLMVVPAGAQGSAQARNVVLVGHNNLNGHGDGGEGMAIQLLDGRRIL